jgi:hypothetical protein
VSLTTGDNVVNNRSVSLTTGDNVVNNRGWCP